MISGNQELCSIMSTLRSALASQGEQAAQLAELLKSDLSDKLRQIRDKQFGQLSKYTEMVRSHEDTLLQFMN